MAITHDIDNQYTQAVANFVSDLRYEDIPAEVINRIKLLMLDSFGCALFGANLEWVEILKKTLREVDNTEVFGTWGSTDRFSAPHAALVNGTQVQGFELDVRGPRVGIAMGKEHIGQGWHSGATLGVYSAAAGAARALGLDRTKTRRSHSSATLGWSALHRSDPRR